MNRKLKSSSGETLVETLFALLVVVLAMTMLAGSIVSAARVNRGAEDLDVPFQVSNAQAVSGVKVTVEREIEADSEIPVNGSQTNDQNKYCYYTTIVQGAAG